MGTRALDELIEREAPGLPLLRCWAADPAGNRGALLPPDETIRSDTLLALQMTTRSMLGTLAYETGGVSAADGLIRLFGSGARRSLRGVAAAIGCPLDNDPDVIVIGDDAFGGLSALDGGRFGGGARGAVFHLAADDIIWVPLDCGFADFVAWCLTGDLDSTYRSLRRFEPARSRPGFEATWSFYPFLWTVEADGTSLSARAIDADESLRLRLDVHGFTVEMTRLSATRSAPAA